MHLIKRLSLRLNTSIKAEVLAVCCSGAKRKDIRDDFQEAITDPNKPGKSYEAIPKQFRVRHLKDAAWLNFASEKMLAIYPLISIWKNNEINLGFYKPHLI